MKINTVWIWKFKWWLSKSFKWQCFFLGDGNMGELFEFLYFCVISLCLVFHNAYMLSSYLEPIVVVYSFGKISSHQNGRIKEFWCRRDSRGFPSLTLTGTHSYQQCWDLFWRFLTANDPFPLFRKGIAFRERWTPLGH